MRRSPSPNSLGAATFCALLCALATQAPAAKFEALGLVEPEWEATLASVVLGRVESIEVKPGDAVEPGDAILYLESAVEQLDADRRKIVLENQIELKLAQAKLDVLRPAFDRTTELFEQTKSISKDEFDQARLELQLAEAELAQLARREEVEQLEFQLASQQVERRVIRAPKAGVVVEVFPEVGEVCEPRQPMAHLVDVKAVRIILDVDSQLTAQVTQGATVPVRVSAPGGLLEVAGVVDFLSPVVDASSGLRRIRVKIDNLDGRILPGLPATVVFQTQDTQP